jgi:hypothetical protein
MNPTQKFLSILPGPDQQPLVGYEVIGKLVFPEYDMRQWSMIIPILASSLHELGIIEMELGLGFSAKLTNVGRKLVQSNFDWATWLIS